MDLTRPDRRMIERVLRDQLSAIWWMLWEFKAASAVGLGSIVLEVVGLTRPRGVGVLVFFGWVVMAMSVANWKADELTDSRMECPLGCGEYPRDDHLREHYLDDHADYHGMRIPEPKTGNPEDWLDD